MSDQRQQLTQVTSNSWIVSIGKKEFELSDAQMEILRQATTAGKQGLVWFNGFAISIPHISFIHKKTKPPMSWNEVDPRELALPELTQEQRDINRQKIQEMKSKLLEKYQPK